MACGRLSRAKGKEVTDARCKVSMIGAVGSDKFGDELISSLKTSHVETEYIKVKEGAKSGVAVIIVDQQSGENRILMSPNANGLLKPPDLPLQTFLPDVIVLQLEIPLPTLLHGLEIAREKGIEVVLNPAPAQKLPKEAYLGVTHLIVNESEASIITSTTEKQVSWTRSGEHMDRLIELGVRHVTITLGAEGVIYMDTRKRLVRRFPAEKVKVVDTTGAGDTFVGAYVSTLAGHKNLPRDIEFMSHAVAWANRAAAKSVQREGAQSAIPWQNEVSYENLPDGEWKEKSFEEWKQ